jgi:hypothetical protein
MQDFDRGFKEVARLVGRQLALVAGIECDDWRPIMSEVQMAERFADRAFLARSGRERFAVYFEAYTRWDRNAPWNLQTKAALLSERERVPTRTVAFILQRRGYRRQGGLFRLEVRGQPTQALWIREVPMWEQQPQPWWEDVPALMPLYPLCHHGRRPREAVVHAAGVIRDRLPAGPEQADALFLLSIFGNLASRGLDAVALIGREIMMESRIGREMRDIGRVEQTRELVLAVLEFRFGAEVAHGFAESVNAVDDLAQLNELHGLAIRCQGPDEFRTGLLPPATRPRRRR